MLGDKIVHGICDRNVQEALLRFDSLTLEKAAQLCRSSEQSKIQVEQLNQNFAIVYVIKDTKSNFRDKSNSLPKCQFVR